jgi:phage-related protein
MNIKIRWLGASREDIRRFLESAKPAAGYQLYRVQLGMDPKDWKPMPTIGTDVREIRIQSEGAYRVIYVAKFEEAIYVLHAFEKKAQKTAKRDIELARSRFKELVRNRS